MTKEVESLRDYITLGVVEVSDDECAVKAVSNQRSKSSGACRGEGGKCQAKGRSKPFNSIS